MKQNVYDRMRKAKEEHLREMRETALISACFPDVTGIVVTMRYSNRYAPEMRRTLNFRPDSHAFFKISCLGEDCVDGGLDMTAIVTSMVGNHETLGQGALFCCNNDSESVHADMSYRISITYT